MRSIPWQKRFRRGISRPGVRLAALSVSRSNGKSFLVADLARHYLLGSHADTECLVVASDFRQSKIILRYLMLLLREDGVDLDDKSRWLCRDSVNQGMIRDRKTGITVRAMSSRPAGLHGRVFGLALVDEPRELESGQRDAILAALTSGMGKVEGAKLIALGTMPSDPDHWFSAWCRGGADYVQVHAARPGDPVFWLRTIRRANPSFDHLPALRTDLLARREKARVDPDVLTEWKSRHLNMGVSDRAGALFVDVEEWTGIEADILPAARGPQLWGLDPGGSSAFTAVVVYWPATGRLEGHQVVGGVPDIRTRAKRDHVGKVYAAMQREGSLVVQPGRRRPSLVTVIREALQRYGRPRLVVTDFFRLPEVRDALDLARVRCEVVPRRTQWSHQTEDIRRAQAVVVEEGRVSVAQTVAWPTALGEARVEYDDSRNMRLATGAAAGRRRRSRTDLVSALVLVLAEADRRWPGGVVPHRRKLRIVVSG